MKLTFLSDKLQEKLIFLNHAVSSRGQLPILSCFLLETEKGKLKISTTDLEIGMSSIILANVEEEGRVAVIARNFTDIFSNLGSQKITLFTEGQSLFLKGEKIKATFQTMPAEDFPNLYEEKGEEVFSTKKEDIEKHLLRVVFAAGVDTSRPALSGVLLDEEKNNIVLVATDGYRLSIQKNVYKAKERLEKPLVVPSRLLKEMMFMKETGSVGLMVSQKNNQVLFFQGDSVLVGRLIEAEYPEYQKIIPTEFNTKTEINKEELLKAIKITTVFARETANIIKLKIEKTKIVVSANSPSVGEDMVDVEAKTTGESNEIAFNAKYLLDFLSTVDAEDVVFEMNGPFNPGVFRIKDDNTFLHLIMPIRVQG